MKIGLDIDDTLVNTKDVQEKIWKRYIKEYPKKGYTEKLPANINGWDDPYIQDFWDIYREELTFSPTFKDNAAKIIKQLNKDGYELCVITSRPDAKYNNLHKLTRDWFNKNDIAINTIYTDVKDKAEFLVKNNIDLIVDDDIKHITKALELGKKAILFNSNEDFNGLQTTNWIDLYNIIKST